MATAPETTARSPYELIGGADAIRDVVDRFYDLMEERPEFAELRALHAADLMPMRESLADFLTAWTGGPRHWFEQRPGKCLMSAHAQVKMTSETAEQWARAMREAIASSSIDPELGDKFAGALCDLALRMA